MPDRHEPPFDIAFRPLDAADFGLLERWLRAPHVREWWGEPLDVARIEAKYGPRAQAADPTRVYIILVDGRPVGLIQRYRHDDYPDWERAVGIPRAAGIDYLIGEADACGRGVGSRAIALFSPRVFAAYRDLDTIVAVPQHANRASCRALEKAGYTLAGVRTLESDDPTDAGPSAIYVLHQTEALTRGGSLPGPVAKFGTSA